ncbi:MAG: glycosyltransferase WbuB [Halobacteriovoraceae bacterium]|nr:glycosyltransferase WbuB [Halobacteriovoraceae bacterium]|tara:strand:+ start:19373 stop:20608 length:1236 start_codon:yes stop_codon:yes gene_type:complete
MRILYFHQHFSTPAGASGTRSYEFARKLIRAGHEVTMVCGSTALANRGISGEFHKGVRIGIVDEIKVVEIKLEYSNALSLFKRSIIFLRFAFRSIVIAFKTDYDILFATSTPLTISIPGICMRVLKPWKKFVFEVRDLWPELPRAMGVITNPVILFLMAVLEKTSYLSMHAGVALSPGIKKGMMGSFSKNKRIELVPNGSDLNIFTPGSIEQKDKKENLIKLSEQIKAGDFVAVFTGAHGMANGLDAVLDSAKLLLEHEKIKLVFIGDGKLKKSLMERASNEELTNCIFLNPVPKLELAKLMQEVDLGMMVLDNIPAFYYGTSPNKFFDYISAGLPILNNYPGWIADMISEDECGIAVKPNDLEGFSQAIIRLSSDRKLVQMYGQNARNLAQRDFDRDKLSDKVVNLLESL